MDCQCELCQEYYTLVEENNARLQRAADNMKKIIQSFSSNKEKDLETNSNSLESFDSCSE